jgi:hypothetical protein
MSADSDMVELRESVALESQADLMAAACRFGDASRLMRQVNAIRRRAFGSFDPNELRERTRAALSRARAIQGTNSE